MKKSVLLTVTTVTWVLLFPIHVAQDVVFGLDRAGVNQAVGIVIMVVWLYPALILPERLSGLIMLLIGGVLAAGMPVLHLRGRFVNSPEFPGTPGAALFMWGLWMIGASGALSAILAAQGLFELYVNRRALRSRRATSPANP